MNTGALSGLKVIEYSDFISGPYCGKLLSDLGAKVIKVERPGTGDTARSWGPFPGDIPHLEKSGLFLYLNTNKLGVTLDVNDPLGRDIFKELVKWADVLIENNPPHEMEKLKLNYERLLEVNPGIVMTSITPFGQTGPYRDYKASDLITFQMSGMGYTTPYLGVENVNEYPPLKGAPHASDFAAGLAAAVDTMSAVFAQQSTGLGQSVDVSMQEVLASMARRELSIYTYESMPWRREKGLRGVEVALLPCSNGHAVMVPISDEFWKGVVKMMGNPDWAESDLFATRFSRRTNWDALEMMVSEWTSQHTVEQVNSAAQKESFPCTTVNTVKDVVNSKQLAFREFFIEIEHKQAGKFKYPGAPYKLSSTPWRVERAAPCLGEHNEKVYCEMLHYSKQDLVKMRQARII